MKLIFFRHALAEKKHLDDTELDDFRRKITDSGIIETKEVIQTCHFLFKKLDSIFTSPLSRAVQTAQIIHRHLRSSLPLEIMSSLDALSSPAEFIKDLQSLDDGTYCFVGHEPHLTTVIQLLLTNEETTSVKLDKSGVAVLEGEDISSLQLTTLISPKFIVRF